MEELAGGEERMGRGVCGGDGVVEGVEGGKEGGCWKWREEEGCRRRAACDQVSCNR